MHRQQTLSLSRLQARFLFSTSSDSNRIPLLKNGMSLSNELSRSVLLSKARRLFSASAFNVNEGAYFKESWTPRMSSEESTCLH
jgi:hypothetical protein